MITRRDAIVALLAMPAVGIGAEAAEGQEILGPTVFHWDEMKVVKTKVGEVRSLCKSPTATLDQLEMHVSTLNPGLMSHPPHRHVNEELIILREGECETLSNGKWVKVEPGSVVFNASNSLHGFRNVGQTTATYHVINWSPNKSVAAKSQGRASISAGSRLPAGAPPVEQQTDGDRHESPGDEFELKPKLV